MEIRISRAIHHANVIADILTNTRYPSKHLPQKCRKLLPFFRAHFAKITLMCLRGKPELIGKASGVGRKRKKMLCFRHNTPVRFLFVGKHFAEQAVLSAHSLRHGCRTLRHNRQPHHLPMRMVHAHPCGGPAVFENLHILRICTIAEKMQSIL